MTILTKRLGPVVLAVALAAGLGACGDDDDGDSAATTQATTATTAAGATTTTGQVAGGARITIQNFTFMGIDGQTANSNFTVVNMDSVPHTVSSVDGRFPVWRVEAGQTRTFGSLAAGSYAIRCDIHPQMTGTLVVR
jgi:plastocyanin